MAARDTRARLSHVHIRRASHLPAPRRPRERHRRPGRGADPLALLHARRDLHALGDDAQAGRPPGGLLRGRDLRRARPDSVPWRLRHVRRDGLVPHERGGLVRGRGARPHRLDPARARGRCPDGPVQRHEVRVRPVRSRDHRARRAERRRSARHERKAWAGRATSPSS